MPNATVLEQKKAIVAQLVEAMQTAKSGILVDYKGINVENDTKLRQTLRKADVTYKVYKNTLLNRAATEVGFGDLIPVLRETSALAYSTTDLVAPAKILSDYAKKSGGKFTIKAGFVEGNVISAQEVTALAELPSKEVLIATVLAGFNAPISGFVNVLNGNIRGLAVALGAILEQKQAEAS
jgi:large subunit ribosomal protein L10